MSEQGTDDSGRIHWYASGEKKLEPISGEVSIIKTPDNGIHASIGNTGLVVRFGEIDTDEKYDITADFVPGGVAWPDQLSPVIAAKALSYGFSTFVEWTRNTNVIDQNKIKYLA